MVNYTISTSSCIEIKFVGTRFITSLQTPRLLCRRVLHNPHPAWSIGKHEWDGFAQIIAAASAFLRVAHQSQQDQGAGVVFGFIDYSRPGIACLHDFSDGFAALFVRDRHGFGE